MRCDNLKNNCLSIFYGSDYHGYYNFLSPLISFFFVEVCFGIYFVCMSA